MPSSPALSEKPENMPPLQPSQHLPAMQLALLLSLMLCGGLPGCGPASSDNSPNLDPRANVDTLSVSQQSSSLSNNPFTPISNAASPVPLASINGSEAGEFLEWIVPRLLSQDIQWRAWWCQSRWSKNSSRRAYSSDSGPSKPGHSQLPRERSIRSSWPSKIRTNESGLGRSN
jgi:hypothetical protein